MATREELLALRQEMLEQVERLRKTGDYGAGAADIRRNSVVLLALVEDRL